MKYQATGIILAGGKSSRFGNNKAFAEIDGLKIIEKVAGIFKMIFPEIIIVANDISDYEHLGAKVVCDIIKCRGPLSGIHAGLTASSKEYCFVAACDMPFLNSNLIRYMLNRIAGQTALVPRYKGELEPLHAFYSKSCIKPIEVFLRSGGQKVNEFIRGIDASFVEDAEILAADPSGMSFVNINTQEDLDRSRRIAINAY